MRFKKVVAVTLSLITLLTSVQTSTISFAEEIVPEETYTEEAYTENNETSYEEIETEEYQEESPAEDTAIEEVSSEVYEETETSEEYVTSEEYTESVKTETETESTTEAETTVSLAAFDQTDHIDNLSVHITAPAGVFPEGSYFIVRKAEQYEEDAVKESVDEVRETEKNVYDSLIVDITVYDKDGNEIQPDTSYGEVNITFGTYIDSQIVENPEVNADVYHIEETDYGYEAEKLDSDIATYDDQIIDAEELISVKTDGFSYYVIEYTYETETEEYHWYTNGENILLSNILTGLGIVLSDEISLVEADSTSVSLTELEGDWMISMTEPGQTAVLSVSVGNPITQVYDITLESGSTRIDSVYPSTQFIVEWNDNTGSTEKDESNLADRPTWEESKENYAIYYTVNDGEYIELTEETMEAIGITQMYDIDAIANTTDNSNQWQFNIDSSTYISLPETITVDGEKQTIKYFLMQKDPESGETGYDGYLTPETNIAGQDEKITNTVEIKYEAYLDWKDNNNAYNTRPDMPEGRYVTDLFSVQRVSSASTVVEDVEDGHVFLDVDADGNIKITLDYLPAYDEDGQPYIYELTSNISTIEGTTDYYSALYNNVGQNAHETNALYSGGTVDETLTNELSFSFNVEWIDGDKDVSERPGTTMYLYVLPENVQDVTKASPVKNFDGQSVIAEDGKHTLVSKVDGSTELPKYDSEGVRLVYFALEKGLSGDYVVDVDNSTSIETEEIIEDFNEIKSGYTDIYGNPLVKYVLNEGTIYNRLTGSVEVPCELTLYIAALQGSNDVDVTFTLQKLDENGNWVDVPQSECIIQGDDTPIQYVFNDYYPEESSVDFKSPAVYKYDSETGEEIVYRWVQTSVRLNNGTKADVGTDDKSWDETRDTEEILYDYIGENISLGKSAPGVDDTNVDVFLIPEMEVRKENGVWKTFIVDEINAAELVKINKVWTAYGEIVSDEVAEAGGYADYVIKRDDGKHSIAEGETPDASTLYDMYGNPVYNVRLYGTDDNWTNTLPLLSRFDRTGKEYGFTVTETYYTKDILKDKYEKSFSHTYNYATTVENIDDEQTAKEIVSNHINYITDPGGLSFEVTKTWLDGSDLIARKGVFIGIFKVATGQAVSMFKLNTANNWTKIVGISKGMTCLDGTTLEELGNHNDYLLLEIGVGSGDEPEVLTLYDGKNWTELTTDDLSALKTKVSQGISEYNSENATGSLGTDDYEKKLQYYYNVFVEQTSSGYYYDFTNQRYATLDLELTKSWTDDNRLTDSTFEIKRTDSDGSNEIVLGTFVLPKDGTKINDDQYTYTVEGLPKYDNEGNPYTYSIMEIGLDGALIPQPESGTEVNASVTISSGDTYSCSSKKASTDYSDDHHNGDVQHWTSSNTLSGSYPLDVNIIWYDDGRSNEDVNRPNVYVNVYRITDDAMFSDDMTLREYIESDEYDESVLAARLEELENEASLITPDKMWNTIVNDWMWTTSLGDVPRYDGDGHRYIYFATEGFNGSSNKYKNGYINDSSEDVYPITPEDPTSAKDVLDVGSYYGDMVEHTVTLLSDGYHLSSGDPSKYATRTIINFLEDTRTIGGRKLWKMPAGWTIPEEDLPEIKFEVYRSTSKMTNDDGEIEGSYTNSDIKKWADSLGLEPVITFTLNADESGPFSFTGYQYSIQYEQYTDALNNTKIQKYNEYGQTYYYYVYETSVIDGYPAEEIEYSTTDFFIVNVYKFQPPYVQIKVSKNWAIDERTGETDLTNLAPVTISLYAQAVNDDGEAVGDPVYINQTTLNPTEDGYAEYTFTTYKDGVTKIPLTAHNGKNFKFFTVENRINGYEQTATTGGSIGTGKADYVSLYQITEGDEETWSNVGTDINGEKHDDTVKYSNTYTGDVTSMDVTKNWEDDYVDNDLYRPDSITLTINRKSGGIVDEDYSLDITLYKKDFVKTGKWTGSAEDLVKYDAKGKLYTYFIAKETFNDTNETADEVGDGIGYYKLTKLANRSITNTLIDSVSVNMDKTWSYATDEGNVDITSYDTFDEFRQMNAFPQTVRYVLQRKTETTDWEYVPASLGDDVRHKITLNGELVLGYEVNISKITRSSFKKMFNLSASWEHLPRTVLGNSNDPYEYRIIEIFTWNSGEVNIVDGSESVNGIDPTINIDNSSLNISESINNNLITTKVKIAKEWEDENGFDDLRPDTITLRLISKKDNNEGYLDFELKTTGNEIGNSIYYSDAFYIPSVVVTPLTSDNYSVAEFYNPSTDETSYAEFDGSFVIDNETESGVSIIRVTNPSVTERRTISVSGTKNWQWDDDWGDELRPSVTFSLQYLKQGSADNWITMTSWDSNEESSISNFTDTKQPEKFENVASDADSETVTWNNLYKYWKDNTVDGVGELIQYRIVETTDAAVTSYTVNNNGIISYTYEEDTDNYTGGSLTNTLTSKTFVVAKTWKEEDSEETIENLQKMIDLKAIPETIRFAVLYSTTENGEYQEYKQIYQVDASVIDLASGDGVPGMLPQLDKNGQKIRYKIVETQIKFKDGTFQDAYKGIGIEENSDIEITGEVTNVLFENTLKVTDVSATKTWDDEDNREAYQNTVYLQLYRDGEAYGDVVSIEKDPETDTWSTYTWPGLPYYKNDSDEESVYTVKEIAIGDTEIENSVYVPKYRSETTEFTADYTAVKIKGSDENRTVTIENEYTPNKGVVFATKTWENDDEWSMVTRPENVEVKLQYSLDNGNTWNDVTTNTLADGRYPDDGVYTTSDVTQYISSENLQAAWNDLPVFVGGRSEENEIMYRVVETAVKGYVTSYENNNCTLNPGRNKTVEITNTAEKKSVKLTKNWTDFEGNDFTKTVNELINTKTIPEEIKFEIFYKMTDENGIYGEWTSSGITFTGLMTDLAGEGITYDNLPETDRYEMPVKYKIEETGIRYKGETEMSAAGAGVTLTAVETEVSDTTKTLNYTNKLDVIKVSVSKEWLDENNREEYEDSVTVQLYRDGMAYEEPVVISKDNNWTYTWDNLPSYKNNEDELSVYTVEELKIGEESKENTKYSDGISYEVTTDGVTTSYDVFSDAKTSKEAKETERNINIVNKYVPERGTVNATKTWNDTDWSIATRPEGITVTLEFSTDSGATWNSVTKSTLNNDLYADDGIYTTSEVTQTITAENPTATWENLPVYKGGHATDNAVMYRVVEADVDGYTTVYANNSCTLNEVKSQNIEVINTLVLRSINIKKNWTDKEDNTFTTDINKMIELGSIPSDIRFAVLYRITDKDGIYGEWTDSGFTFDASMTELLSGGKAYKNLPEYDKNGNKIEYKISEIAVKYKKEGSFHEESDGVSLTDKETTVGLTAAELGFTNKLETKEVSVSKIWEDENNREDYEGSITVQLYRDGAAYGDAVTISAADGWTYTWVDLPVYKNEGSETSEYTIEETKINDVNVSETVYKDGISYQVKESDVSSSDYTQAVITNETENEIIITNKYVPERGTVNATKTWDDADWNAATRPEGITVTLEFSTDGGETWNAVTKSSLKDDLYTDDGIYTTSEVTQTITAENPTATWDNLPVYLGGHAAKDAVMYRVVETAVDGYETTYKNNECSLQENDSQNIEVINTLVLRSINVKKNWTDNEDNDFLTNIIKMIDLKAIPSDIRFSVLYRITDENGVYGEWTDSGFTFDASMTELLVNGKTYENLPEYDRYGQKMEYKIVETAVKYSGENDFHAASDGIFLTEKETEVKDSVTEIDFTNKLQTKEVLVSKIWEDEQDRDGHEGSVTVQLYRDGLAYDEPVTISAADGWTHTWVDLPVYKNEGSETSEYTIVETKINGKNVSETVYKDGVSYKVKGSDISSSDYTQAVITDETENEIVITNKYIPDRGTFTASKIWKGDENWYQVSRPESVELTLEYSIDGGKTYSVITQHELNDGLYPDGGVYTTSDAVQYVTAENTEASWADLPVYYNNDTKTKVLYRVVETEVKNYKTSYEGNEVSLNAGETKHADVTNTLITTNIKLNKKWYQKETGTEITNLEELVSFDALPKQLVFKLEYSTDDGNTWNLATSLNGDGTYTFNTLDKSVTIDVKIPQFMNDQNTEILYRITECTAIYQNEEIYAEGNRLGNITSVIEDSFIWDGNTVPVISADNSYESGSVKAIKEWNDEDNRDDLEKSVKFTLYSSDTDETFEAILSKLNSWEKTWNNLPVYTHDGLSLAEYSIEETLPDEYSVSYEPSTHVSTITNGGTAVITGTNTHVPYRDTVTATKVWNDLEDVFDARTTDDTILLALQYKDGDTWVFVDSDEDLTDETIYAGNEKAYTSSSLVQEADGNEKKAVWENVPVNFGGKAITYRVAEVVLDGDEYVVSDIPGYSYTSDEFTLVKDTDKEVTGTNTLITQKIQFTKNWNDEFDNDGYGTRPDKVVFEVSYSHGDRSGYFEVELTENTAWTSDEIEIPYVDGEGNKYSFSISERIEYNDGTVVENKVGGYAVTLSESDSDNWTLTGEENNWILINNKETPDAATLVITAGNDLHSGSLVINKIWNDGDNRDSLRRNVVVQLLRDGAEFGEEITLSPDNNWTYEWKNLPVYKNSGVEKSVYEVKEIKVGDQDVVDYRADNWTVSVADGLEILEDKIMADATQAEITNTYIPNTLSVSATKAWSDGNDKYLLSPKSIQVHLEYSIDYDPETGEGTWETVKHIDSLEDAFGTDVCTTSEVEQTIVITGEKELRKSSVVTWNDLPEKTRIPGSSETESTSVEVYYRVKESVESSDPFYTQTSTVKSYDDRNDLNTAEIVLTNTMATGIIRATKSWNDSSDTSQRPSTITLVLYRDGEEFDRQIVKTSGICRYIWTGLPVYRANGEKYVYSVKEEDVAFGYVASYTDCDDIELTPNRVSNANITNDLYVGSLTVNKVWEHDISKDRPSRITYMLYRDGELFTQRTVIPDRSGNWEAYTFKNLPVYKEGTEENREKSVYTLVEKHVAGYTTAYTGDVENIVFEATMTDTEEITITNTQRTGNLKINKIWLDENNRHGIRTNVSINIYRDMPEGTSEEDKADYLYTTWTAEDTTDWETLIKYLPTYQKGSDTEYSVYTLEEAGQNESYEVTWTNNGINIEENSEGSEIVTNTYVPEKKILTAEKAWDDFNDRYEERPSSVTFTINWSSDDGATWQQVQKGTLEDGRYPDGGVYTTSDVTQTLNLVDGEWETALWENLPCEILGEDGEVKTLTYKIVEDEIYNYRPVFDYDENTGIVLTGETTNTVVTNRYIRFMMPFSGEDGIMKMIGLGFLIIVSSIMAGIFARKKKEK